MYRVMLSQWHVSEARVQSESVNYHLQPDSAMTLTQIVISSRGTLYTILDRRDTDCCLQRRMRFGVLRQVGSVDSEAAVGSASPVASN